jgi:hydroxyacylglutathione hydrolase
LLDSANPLALVVDDARQAEEATRRLSRIGYDRVIGYLAASLSDWAAAGLPFGRMHVTDARIVNERLDSAEDWTLLDVRSEGEVASQAITGAQHEYLGTLPERITHLDRRRHYTLMCGSGVRATIAASLLLRSGFDRVDVFFGSMGARREARRA